MLKGFDISNWQKGLVLKKDSYDFIIAKATEGTNFVDSFCDGFIQQVIKQNKLFGFYHFARNNNPIAEADFFINNCLGYFQKGIPVLDIEDFSIPNWNTYAEQFVKRVYEKTKVYPLIYCSASQCRRFEQYIYSHCGLWVAGYPKNYTNWINSDMPYNIAPWAYYCIWQFTSSFAYADANNAHYQIDANLAPLSKEQWCKYAQGDNAKPTPTKKQKLSDSEINKLTEAVKQAAKEL